MSTWLGWLAPWGAPITLLGESAQQVAEAQRELARIGIDRPAAVATGTPEQWAGSEARLGELATATFVELAATYAGRSPHGLPRADVVLDVRLDSEWREGHLDGAVHIPLPALPSRLVDVPDGAVWVHCASGYRASVAASLLARAGRQVVHIDDEYSAAADAGLVVAKP
jgi:rhodanese-related sulfurtransferase